METLQLTKKEKKSSLEEKPTDIKIEVPLPAPVSEEKSEEKPAEVKPTEDKPVEEKPAEEKPEEKPAAEPEKEPEPEPEKPAETAENLDQSQIEQIKASLSELKAIQDEPEEIKENGNGVEAR